MKRLLITLTILLLATMAAAQTPYWLTAINAIGRPGDSASISSVVYADGYIAYHYRQTMRWGEREIFSPNFNVVLARVADDGSADWLVDIGGTSSDMVSDITTDADGYVYIVGTTYSPAIEIDGQKIVKAGSTSTSDIFVGKFHPGGRCAWITALGGTNDDVAAAVAVDATGHVYVSGSSTGVYGDLPRWSAADAYIAKLDPYGSLVWHRRMGSYGPDTLHGVTVDDAGQVLATGAIGPYNRGYYYVGDEVYPTYTPYQYDSFVVSFGGDGTHLWTQRLGGIGGDMGMQIATIDDDIVVSGYFMYIAKFGPIQLTSASKSADIYVTRMDKSGNARWATRIGDSNADQPRSMLVHNGDVMIAGVNGWDQAYNAVGSARFYTVAGDTGKLLDTRKFTASSGGWGIGADILATTYVGRFSKKMKVNDTTITSPENWSIFISRQYNALDIIDIGTVSPTPTQEQK